jgi:DNA-binding response OmpR family regulator
MSHRSPESSERPPAGRGPWFNLRRASQPTPATPTILLIDDDRSVRESLGRVLAAEAFEVVTAAGGKDALDYLEAHRPDMIITDLRMAPLTGWDLMTHARNRHPAVPIFVITALPARATAGADLLATRFFQKPVDIDALLLAIRGHFGASDPEKPES